MTLSQDVRLYDSLIEWIHDCGRLSDSTILNCVQGIAELAVAWHPGRFSDGAIENMLLEVGSRINHTKRAEIARPVESQFDNQGKRRILHVTTRAERIGGHTRTIRNWIHLDKGSCHSLALTDQADAPVPSWLEDAIRKSRGQVFQLHESGILQRAHGLRTLAAQSADMIILHHWGFDVVPVVAFADETCPPVAILDHADHCFWLGSGIADLHIGQREAGRRLAIARREVERSIVLPIPLEMSDGALSKEEARERLGISSDTLVLLSIGRGLKYSPSRHHDFFRTIRRVLEALPNAHLYVVGLNQDGYDRMGIGERHPRVHCCGSIEDPTIYRMAADLYLESFPFGSATALLETAARGIPVVLPYAPLTDLLVTNHGLETILRHWATEDEYVAMVLTLAADAKARASLGERLRSHVLLHHTGEGWLRSLAGVYAILDEARHHPRRITVAEGLDSPVDLGISMWQDGMRADAARDILSADAVHRFLFDQVYEARRNGYPFDAARMLLWGVKRWSWDRRVASSAVKLIGQLILRPFIDERRLFAMAPTTKVGCG